MFIFMKAQLCGLLPVSLILSPAMLFLEHTTLIPFPDLCSYCTSGSSAEKPVAPQLDLTYSLYMSPL